MTVLTHAACRAALLEGSPTADVERHTAACDECRAFAQSLGLVLNTASGVFLPPTPSGLADRVVGAVRAEMRLERATPPGQVNLPLEVAAGDGTAVVIPLDRRRRPERRRVPARRRILVPATLAAAAALLLGILMQQRGPQPIDTLLVAARATDQAGSAHLSLNGTISLEGATTQTVAIRADGLVSFNRALELSCAVTPGDTAASTFDVLTVQGESYLDSGAGAQKVSDQGGALGAILFDPDLVARLLNSAHDVQDLGITSVAGHRVQHYSFTPGISLGVPGTRSQRVEAWVGTADHRVYQLVATISGITGDTLGVGWTEKLTLVVADYGVKVAVLPPVPVEGVIHPPGGAGNVVYPVPGSVALVPSPAPIAQLLPSSPSPGASPSAVALAPSPSPVASPAPSPDASAEPSSAPTAEATPSSTPRSTPSPVPSRSPSPSAAFGVSPGSLTERCTNGDAGSFSITLDNSGGNTTVAWSIQVPDQTSDGAAWASVDSTSGTVAPGAVQVVGVTPNPRVCAQATAAGATYRLSVQYARADQTSGSLTTYVRDTIAGNPAPSPSPSPAPRPSPSPSPSGWGTSPTQGQAWGGPSTGP
ncbi:MAG: hypothetical protein ACYDAY_02770 [Candidatus Dormibacteria bacterium]